MLFPQRRGAFVLMCSRGKITARCLKMCVTCFPSYECFSLSNYQPLQICPHVFCFFSGSTHRPLALTLVSLPEMQPCFSLPISHLGFLTLRWRRAPNKIWVRLESPNIRIQYLSPSRLQAANRRSSGVFFL